MVLTVYISEDLKAILPKMTKNIISFCIKLNSNPSLTRKPTITDTLHEKNYFLFHNCTGDAHDSLRSDSRKEEI